jgi:hypothetical protein
VKQLLIAENCVRTFLEIYNYQWGTLTSGNFNIESLHSSPVLLPLTRSKNFKKILLVETTVTLNAIHIRFFKIFLRQKF